MISMYSRVTDSWLSENYYQGTEVNTNVGDTVWVKGMDWWDEVLYPHKVTGFYLGKVLTREKNPSYAIPPDQRGQTAHTEWYHEHE